MLMYAVAITTQSDDVNVPKNNAPQATKKTNSFLLIHLDNNKSTCSLLIS